MANWARGLSQGLQTGLQIGSVLRDAQQREALAQEAARYTPTEGAYGPGLQENIQQVRGLQEQAVASGMAPEEAARQYAPAIAELERRSGLAAPDYSIGAQTFGTREEAMRAAAPMRAQGLANVYRQFGDTERADIAEARAQQAQATGLQIRRAERAEAEDLATEARRKEDAKWWQSRLTDAEGNARAPSTEDFLAASQRNAQSLIGAGKLNEAGAAFREYMTTARGQIELQTAERTEAIRKAAAALQAGDLKPAEEFYKKFVPNGANVKDFSMDAKGNIKINQVDLDGKPLPATTLTRDQLLQGLVAFNDPAKLIDYTQQTFLNTLRMEQFEEQKRHARVTERQGAERLAIEKKGPLTLTLTALKNAGIAYTDEDVRSLAGLNKDDNALLKAQVDAVVKGVSPDNPKSVGAAQEQIRGLFTQAAAAKQQRMVQDAARKAHKDGKIDDFVQELRGKNVTDDVIAAQIRAAGLPVPPSLTPAAAPAQQETYTPLSQRLQGLFPGGGAYTPSSTFGLSR